MFCPVCNQEQVSEETRFCSRCGFLLTGISQVIAHGGVLPQHPVNNDPNALSPRQKGIKQGALLTLSSFLIVPLLIIITLALNAKPFVAVAAAIITFWGGLLRMLYAFLFESKYPPPPPLAAMNESVLPETFQRILPSKKQAQILPPQQQGVPISSYVPPATGNWRDTNDLAAPPPSVTDPTTKLLEKDE